MNNRIVEVVVNKAIYNKKNHFYNVVLEPVSSHPIDRNKSKEPLSPTR